MSEDEKTESYSVSGYLDSFRKVISDKLDLSKTAALFTHRCPDPDAIGSLMGMKWLLKNAFGLDSVCYYAGQVAHPQNNAVVNLLDPGLVHAKEYNSDDHCVNILLDTIPINAGVAGQVDFDIVIDHHKDPPNGGFRGLYINIKAGSCCATVFNLFSLTDNFFNLDNDQDSKIATALIAGIVTDTEYMLSDDTTNFEFEAFTKLYEFKNDNFLKEIVFFKRPKFWIDKKAEACSSAKIDSEGYAIVGLGIIPEKHRDLIADMADEMVKWMSVETAIAFAVVQGDRVEGSVRSDNASMSVPDLCRIFAGEHGMGGGKLGKGAYRYSLGGMSIDQDESEEMKNKIWETVRDKEISRIQRLLKK